MKVLHLIYVHGFQGNDTTFQSFPSDLQAYLAEHIPPQLGIEVRSSLYPTYKSVKPIADATRNFLEWLNTQPPGPIILLGHSMGGLLVADAATHISNNPAAYPGAKPSRIVGVIAFDTPYLGMHPHVVISGIASLFPKDKGKKKVKDKEGKDKDKEEKDQAHQDNKHRRAEKAMNPGVTIVDRHVTDQWDGFKRDAEHEPSHIQTSPYSTTPHHSRPSSIASGSDNQSFYSATSSRAPSPSFFSSPPPLPTRPPKFPSTSASSLAPPPPFPIPSPYVAPPSPSPSTLTPPPRLPPRPRPSSPSTVTSYRSTSPSSPALSQLSPSLPSSPPSTLTSPRSPFMDKALSFVSAHSNDPIVKWARKHADDPLTSAVASSETWLLNQQTLLVEQFQFGACMFDPSGLTARYKSLVAWRGKGGMWVNYWTETRPDVRGDGEERKNKKGKGSLEEGEVREDHAGNGDHKEKEAREDDDSNERGSDDTGSSERISSHHKSDDHLEEEDKAEREEDQVEVEDTNTDFPDTINKDEAKRLEGEAKRVKAEEKRMKAEEKRLKADEQKRVKDEQKRIKEEQKLVKAEEKRVKAEQKAEQKAEAKRAKLASTNKLHKDPHPPHGRHFIVLPTGWGQYLGGTTQWEKVVIAGVEDEVAAHTGLFIRGQNLDYDGLVERVGVRVLGWSENI